MDKSVWGSHQAAAKLKENAPQELPKEPVAESLANMRALDLLYPKVEEK